MIESKIPNYCRHFCYGDSLSGLNPTKKCKSIIGDYNKEIEELIDSESSLPTLYSHIDIGPYSLNAIRKVSSEMNVENKCPLKTLFNIMGFVVDIGRIFQPNHKLIDEDEYYDILFCEVSIAQF